ncbi:Tannase, partial [Diplodia seriata]
DNLERLDGVTHDALIEWMNIAYNRYLDTLQITVPDLKTIKNAGGKLVHYHGESVPAGSSIYYFDNGRTLYPQQIYNQSVDALADWYRLFLIPRAAQCGTNSLQPGPWPASLIDTLFEWFEGGSALDRLNSTVADRSELAGETQQPCKWPIRPVWDGNENDSVYDYASID